MIQGWIPLSLLYCSVGQSCSEICHIECCCALLLWAGLGALIRSSPVSKHNCLLRLCVFFFSFPFFLPTSEGSFAWGSGQRVAVRCLSMLSREQGDGSESAAAALLPPCCFFHCRPPPFSSTKAIWTYYFKREKEKKKRRKSDPSLCHVTQERRWKPAVKLSRFGGTG